MYDPDRGFPKVAPYFRYLDPDIGVRWFSEVLGATEVLRLTLDDGRVGHAEFTIGSSVITLGLALTPPVAINPEESRHTLRQMTLVFVDDLDESVQRAHTCGGSVLEMPTDQPWGLRQAVVRDPEGYIWELSKHIRDVAPSEWGAEQTGVLPG
jgi:PhnB protein